MKERAPWFDIRPGKIYHYSGVCVRHAFLDLDKNAMKLKILTAFFEDKEIG